MTLPYRWICVKNKLFGKAQNVKKWKAHFLELQVQQAISQILYKLGTSGLVYSTRYTGAWRFCTKIKIDLFHPKPWFPKTHHPVIN